MIDRITVGATTLMASLAGATAIVRAWPAPARGGRHRSVTAPAPLLRPVEALDQFEARCPYERRSTLHVRFAMGGVQCLECRAHLTTTASKGDS